MVEQEVTVTTRVSGVIDSIQAERGQLVRKGQPLATLDQREFRLDLRAAEETLAVSLADLKRYEELRRQNLTSEAEFEQRRSRHELALVELERAKLVIDRSVVRAPFDGIVADRYARVGEKFTLEESKPLFKVMALEPLLARAYLPASGLQTVKTGDEVTVEAPDFPEARSSGHVCVHQPRHRPGQRNACRSSCRSSAIRRKCCGRGWRSGSRSARRRGPEAMATRTSAPRRRIRATKDSVLIHDIRNLGLRLSLLLSNMEEHYDDPDFKRSAADLLQSTVQKLDGIARSWSSRGDSVLIKVPLELNDLVQEVLRTCRPRGRRFRAAGERGLRRGSPASGGIPTTCGRRFRAWFRTRRKPR